MVKEIHVEGHEAFLKAADENKDKTVFALFCGSLGADKTSWCPDCVKAEPVVTKCKQFAAEDAILIHCGVGDRAFWKDQTNIFRKDEKLKLKSVPTLLKWGKPQRLEEEQCAKEDLVKMMFEDED